MNQTTYDLHGVTFTLKNTMYASVMYLRMQKRFVTEDAADKGALDDFCYLMAHTVSLAGVSWQPVSDTSSDEEFTAAYFDIARRCADHEEWSELLLAVLRLHQTNADAVNKPDHELTEAEKTDPKSAKRAKIAS